MSLSPSPRQGRRCWRGRNKDKLKAGRGAHHNRTQRQRPTSSVLPNTHGHSAAGVLMYALCKRPGSLVDRERSAAWMRPHLHVAKPLLPVIPQGFCGNLVSAVGTKDGWGAVEGVRGGLSTGTAQDQHGLLWGRRAFSLFMSTAALRRGRTISLVEVTTMTGTAATTGLVRRRGADGRARRRHS